MNRDGPIVFCVVSRYHGGAFVVFLQRLNEWLEAVALEGFRHRLGYRRGARRRRRRSGGQAAHGAGAANRRARRTHRGCVGAERQRLRGERAAAWEEAHAEERGWLAAEFDSVHSVQRALQTGSISRIIPPSSMRLFIEAVERGMRRAARPAASSG